MGMTDRPGPNGASTPSGPLFQDTTPDPWPEDQTPVLSEADLDRLIATDLLAADALDAAAVMGSLWEQGAADAAAREHADLAQAAADQEFLNRIEKSETARDTRLRDRQRAGWPTRDPGIREKDTDWPDH